MLGEYKVEFSGRDRLQAKRKALDFWVENRAVLQLSMRDFLDRCRISPDHRKIVFSGWFEAGAGVELTATGLKVATPGKFCKMVEKVEHVTFSGTRARQQGQEILYITERCVIRLTDQGLVATEIMPGIDPARDIVAASQGRVTLAENATTMPLSLLAEGPMGWQP